LLSYLASVFDFLAINILTIAQVANFQFHKKNKTSSFNKVGYPTKT